MAAKNKPYEQFGTYILFKKLETDALGDLWRAGRIESNALGATVALRRLSGGDRPALIASAESASAIVPLLSGTSFVRNQVIDVVNGVPYVAHEYAGGRSLRHIVDRARGGNGITPNPVPLDQAIVIAEKVALSLATTAELRYQGNRLCHGALIPQFIWISDDGEIRVAGQQLGAGIVASLKDAKVNAEIARYFPPEYQASGQGSKTNEVYAMGAILYLLVTGQEPPDAATASAFAATVRAAKTNTGAAIPDDIRAILDKSLTADPSARFASIADMKTALSALASGGNYSATTFNLAFYLSNLLKKEMESEAIDREKEAKVNIAPYLEAPAPAAIPVAAAAPAAAAAVPTFAVAAEAKPKSKAPLALVAAGALIAIGLGAWVAMGGLKASQPQATATATLASAVPGVPPARQPVAVPEPIVASADPTTTAPTTEGAVDEVARKKAFEDAVKLQLQQEMMKLQSEYTKSLQQQQSRNAPVVSAPPAAAPAAVAEERNSPSAEQLDAQRREAQRQEAQAAAPPVLTQTQQPAAAAPAVAESRPTPAPAQPASTVREGDIVDITAVDSVPRATKAIRPIYPPLAARQKIEGTVIVSALVSESGEVLDVKVLRGDGRFGLDEAAVRAVRIARYSPAVKDGKRVKTWLPQTIIFKQ